MSQDQGIEDVTSSEEQVPPVELGEETPESLPDSNQEAEVQTDENPDELPAEVKERTRRNFERMRQERDEARKLAESLRVQQSQTPYQMPAMPNLSVGQQQNIVSNFIDEDGNVDVTGLQTALQQANTQAAQALQMAQQAQEENRRYEQTRQTQEAYQQFPQLDPDSPDYDEGFYKAVRNHLMGEYSEGKEASLASAAKQVEQYYKPTEQVKKEAVKEYKQSQEKRQQGPIETGKGESRVPQVDRDTLRQASASGDLDAIMARLRGVK